MAQHEGRSGSVTPTRPNITLTIPLPRQDQDAGNYFGTDPTSSFLVASPDHLEGQYQTPPRATSNMLGHSSSMPRSRPILGGRSTSSPLFTRRRAMSSNQRIASGLPNLHVGTPQSVPRWTVFGQLMENEGQLPTPVARRRLSSTRPADHHGAIGSGFDFNTMGRSNADPFLDIESVVEEDSESSRPPSWIPSVHGASTTECEDEYDSSDCSESDSCDSGIALQSSNRLPLPPLPWYSLQHIPAVPVLYCNVLKCAIAYFLASLFTFNPYLSNILNRITSYEPGPFTSGHLIATIAVYFNPAKTKGGMIEADIFCLAGLLYSAFVCLSCMSMFWWFEKSPGWEWLGDLVAIFWIGVSMSILAWFKVWMVSL